MASSNLVASITKLKARDDYDSWKSLYQKIPGEIWYERM